MEKEEWIKEVAKLFENEAKLSPEDARGYGESLFEPNEEDIPAGDYSPADAFGDEMQEWAASA